MRLKHLQSIQKAIDPFVCLEYIRVVVKDRKTKKTQHIFTYINNERWYNGIQDSQKVLRAIRYVLYDSYLHKKGVLYAT